MRSMKRTTYDGTYYAKCITNQNWVSNGDGNESIMSIGWGQSGSSGSANAYLDDVGEFQEIAEQFQEWRLMGLKIVFNPIGLLTDGSGTRKYCTTIQSGSFVTSNTLTISEGVLQRLTDYKTFNSEVPFKRYYNCKAMYSRLN